MSLDQVHYAANGWSAFLQNLNVLEILKVGFLGFSFLALLLSFQLMSKVVTTTGVPAENMKTKMIAVIAYIVLTFFSIGAALLFFRLDQTKTVEVMIEKFPSVREEFKMVPLKTREGDVRFDERAEIPVREGDRITIHMYDLDRFIERLEDSVSDLRGDVDGLKAYVVQLKNEKQGLENTQRAVTEAIVEGPGGPLGAEGGI